MCEAPLSVCTYTCNYFAHLYNFMVVFLVFQLQCDCDSCKKVKVAMAVMAREVATKERVEAEIKRQKSIPDPKLQEGSAEAPNVPSCSHSAPHGDDEDDLYN